MAKKGLAGRGEQDTIGAMRNILPQTMCLVWAAFLAVGLASCAAPPPPALPDTPTAPPSATAAATATAAPTRTPVPPSPLPPTEPPSPPPGVQVCSPLEGIEPAALGSMINNPFHPPRMGSDDPHQGVDFGDILAGTSISQQGRGVQAVLPGVVMAVMRDRFPYGNAVIVEVTGETLLPPNLDWPTPVPTLAAHPSLTCPASDYPSTWEVERRSLYLLYAHMQGSTQVQVGDSVSCGQTLGAVGNSGNSINPHLHLEARIGPVGARLESLAHYTNSASANEMSAYCLWRVSGWFQPVNPMRLFEP
jgi:murein DD-endopeptidase MepM/ murein hydrolase activator NlpD